MIFSSGIVIVKSSPRVEYLFLRNKSMLDFPKGKLEPGETFFEAALRETKEESGLTDLRFSWGHIYKETSPYTKRKNKIARYYLATLVSGQVEIRPNEKTGLVEHDGFDWLTYHEAAQKLLIPRVQEILDWAYSIVEVRDAKSLQ